MAKNKLGDAQDHLFASLEILNDETLSKETVELEIEKAKTKINLVKGIVEVNKLYHDGTALMLDAMDKGLIARKDVAQEQLFLAGS